MGYNWLENTASVFLPILKRDCLTMSQTKNLDSAKPKQFADDNFKFVKNCEKFSKRIENTVGRGEIAHYEQFLLFPQCLQKTCIAGT